MTFHSAFILTVQIVGITDAMGLVALGVVLACGTALDLNWKDRAFNYIPAAMIYVAFTSAAIIILAIADKLTSV